MVTCTDLHRNKSQRMMIKRETTRTRALTKAKAAVIVITVVAYIAWMMITYTQQPLNYD
jgi:hypothetical protein